MGNAAAAAEAIRAALDAEDRSYAWLARATAIPYKRVLSEIKYGTRPLSLDTALAASKVLGLTLGQIVQVA